MDTRQRILTAAAQAMREHGYARATTKAVARAAGLSEGSLYNYFPSKEALFLAVLGDQLPGFITFVRSLPRRAGHGTVRDNLTEVAGVALAFYQESVPLGISVSGDPALLSRLRGEVQARGVGPQKANELVAAYLRAEQDLGRVSSAIAPEAAADLLIGACFQRAYLQHFLGEKIAPDAEERFVAGIVATVLWGLGPA